MRKKNKCRKLTKEDNELINSLPIYTKDDAKKEGLNYIQRIDDIKKRMGSISKMDIYEFYETPEFMDVIDIINHYVVKRKEFLLKQEHGEYVSYKDIQLYSCSLDKSPIVVKVFDEFKLKYLELQQAILSLKTSFMVASRELGPAMAAQFKKTTNDAIEKINNSLDNVEIFSGIEDEEMRNILICNMKSMKLKNNL